MDVKVGLACRLGAGLLLCANFFSLQATEPYQEYRKRIESSQNITALKSSLFGESVSLYNGKTDFYVTDIDVPGNSALPVRLQRRFGVEIHLAGTATNFNSNIEGAGAWDIEVPYIAGMFPSNGWSEQRCSGSMVPNVPSAFRLTEIWQGNTIHIPGDGDRTLLGLEAGTPRPADGIARKWTTSQRDAIDCIPMQAGLAGEGYRVTTPTGIRYYFDIATTRLAGSMRKTLGLGGIARVGRTKIYLLASKVEDRFGNTVQYQYNADGHPVRIWSSDGREIALSYNGVQLVSATSAGRTWNYEYGVVEDQVRLTSVTMPDGSKWGYSYSNALSPPYVEWDGNSTANCAEQPPAVPASFTFAVTHPSGATGTFTFGNARHYRSGIHMSECLQRINTSTQEYYYELGTPNFFDIVSLYSKSIAGPGISAPLKWTYSYGGSRQALWGTSGSAAAYPCTTCPTEKEVVVTNPDQTKTTYRYGFLYALNEGKLLGSSTLDAAGNVVSISATNYMTTAQVAGQPFVPRYGIIYNGDDPSTAQVRPVVSTAIQQAGDTYQLLNNSFDAMARAQSVTRASAWHSRTDSTEYYDDTTKWILDQPAKVVNSDTGLVASQTSYDSNAMPNQNWAFGKLQQTLSYNADGTVATVKDGNNQTTTLSSWKRGLPQSIGYPDGTGISAVVDDNGWIGSVTDENGYATSYGYDPMGRIASITYPGSDSVAWNSTTQSFQQVGGDEYGLGAGHWRQTISTGNARKVTYFDAFWQPVVTREYDSASVNDTERFQRFAYDHDGRKTFASYPGTTDALSAGVWTSYDALGRATSISQDSELGLLTTLTEYLPGNQTRVTDPRGQITLTGYQVFDQPDYKVPVWIQHPEGAYTDIARDIFGKPTSIRRRNTDSTQSVTRSYVYDGYQQLCKTIEPESGATASGYDGAGNVVWSASGLSLPSTTACDADAAYGSGRRVDRTYDSRNRIKTLTFPDGNGNQTWTYADDGKPSQVVTQNEGGASQVVNSYSYNKRRLLAGESMQQTDESVRTLGYGYDANGSLAGITYPSGLYVDHAPNALGQPTKAGVYATAVRYFPNGGMKQFTYGNGLVHTMAQNARQLPLRVVDGTGVLDNSYSYDATGNVVQISDALDGSRTRTMEYDGLGRLTQANSMSFGGDGVMRYTYDALDNLRSAKLTGKKEHNYWYDASNRLTNVNADSGATSIGLGYDVQGNLNNKNGQLFAFDYGNRLREASGKEAYRYDANGRRVRSTTPAGTKILSLYGQDGVLRRQDNQREGKNYEYVSLNGSLVAKLTTIVAPMTPALSVPAYSNNGGYAVSWNAVTYATSYELQEQVNGGAWAAIFTGSGQAWSASGKAGGSYSYRVRACQNGACSGWSAASTAVVQLPPSSAPGISAPGRAANGNYTVSWTTAAGSDGYRLEESANGATWTEVQNSAVTNKTYSGKPAGSYAYRAKGCNPAGCGPVSVTATTQVFYPPIAAPSISVPAQSLGGSYTVSWSGVVDAAKYRLEESVNGGGWNLAQEPTGTSTGFSGKATGSYAYRVQACNDAGCGPYSANGTISVIQPPATPSISVPGSSTTGSYTVSWSAVAMATNYRLEQSVNGGNWGLIQDDGSTSSSRSGVGLGTYGYRVQACNAAGCSGYSGTASIVVTPPPSTPAITSSVKHQWKQGTATKIRCDVKWSSSAGATSYELKAYGGVTQYTGTATSVSAANANYCAPSHVVRACNASGCSEWSTPPYTQRFVDDDNPK